MSIDKFFNKTYDRENYNCAHFATEVWEHLTGFDITHIMKGFLLPPEKRFYTSEERKKFVELLSPVSPCIVLMQRPRTASHVGIYQNGKVLQIHEKGVEFMPLEIATRGFTKIRFYKC